MQPVLDTWPLPASHVTASFHYEHKLYWATQRHRHSAAAAFPQVPHARELLQRAQEPISPTAVRDSWSRGHCQRWLTNVG